jgi:hypothetical protein
MSYREAIGNPRSQKTPGVQWRRRESNRCGRERLDPAMSLLPQGSWGAWPARVWNGVWDRSGLFPSLLLLVTGSSGQHGTVETCDWSTPEHSRPDRA